jgi:hypothetical protein
MNTPSISDYETVLQTVHRWPPAQRLALAQEMLKTLSADIEPRPKRNTLAKALGLLRTEYPAPTDAEIKNWLNERRLEKYG